MTINWQNEVLKHKEQLLADLQGWIQIPSVKEFDQDTIEYPTGKPNRAALDYFLALGARDNFTTKNVANIAGHIEYGSGTDLIGVLGHSDVVPVGDDWTHDPFSGIIEDGFMYGRGTQDDKGPMMAAYYALKIIKELNLPLSKRIRIINGTDEESGFSCVKRYFQTEEMPVTGFSPDADFPLIYGEKGMLNFEIHLADKSPELVKFDAGQRLNMVPATATATILTSKDLATPFQEFLNKHQLTGTHNQDEGKQVLVLHGKSVHAMNPSVGINAAYYLAEFLLSVGIQSPFLTIFNDLFLHDTAGAKLDVAATGEMGDLTLNTGVIEVVDNHAKIAINLRYPHEWDDIKGLESIQQKITPYHAQIENLLKKAPLYVPTTDPLIQTLQAVYQKQTNDYESPLLTTGGGTYARVMDKGVAFGMLFKGTEDRMHQTDERVPIADLLKATAIYAEAIYELAK